MNNEKEGLENILQEQINKIASSVVVPTHNEPFSTTKKLEVDFPKLKIRYPHLSNLINYFERAEALSTLTETRAFILPEPLILLGNPGIGKTDFLLQIAEQSNIPCELFDCASATAGFELTGTSKAWRGGRPGIIHSIVKGRDCENPFIILDEIDKASTDNVSPILPALGGLFEKISAKMFVDEFERTPIDASSINFVCTANNIDFIPDHILDRCQVIFCEPPNDSQRLMIIKSIWSGLKQSLYAHKISIDETLIEIISGENISLREIKKILTQAVAFSVMRNSDHVNTIDLKNSMDFCLAHKAKNISLGFL